MQKKVWQQHLEMLKADFHFFQNTQCRYFPCHGKKRGTGSVPIEDFNCMFCHCPLFFINCGIKVPMLKGFKDCSTCTRIHDKDGWKFVMARLRDHIQVKVKFSRIDIIGQNGGDGEHYE